MKSLKELGFFNNPFEITLDQSPFINLCTYFEKILKLQPNETDCVILYNEIKYTEDGKNRVKKGSLTMIGDKKGFTAMACTVGGPCAIATQLVLDEKITTRGVQLPNVSEIYNQIYEKLPSHGITIQLDV